MAIGFEQRYIYMKAIHRDAINLFQEFDLIIKLKYS